MVEAVGTIHEQKIVHSDLKPANFLFVEGALKLIDFGIAKQDTSKSDTTNIVRDHQVGTVNYMSPEAILNGQPSGAGRAR
jgi:serine/threonine protein kinase